MAAEAAPVEEMAIHTEALQDVETFPTEFTQVLGSSLHRSQDTGSAGPKANCCGLPFPCRSFPPSQALQTGPWTYLLVFRGQCWGHAGLRHGWHLSTWTLVLYLRRGCSGSVSRGVDEYRKEGLAGKEVKLDREAGSGPAEQATEGKTRRK